VSNAVDLWGAPENALNLSESIGNERLSKGKLSESPFEVSQIPGLRGLWELAEGGAGIRIAVLDGPVDIAHPCFQGASFEEVPALIAQSVGPSRHGTAVASILFAQPNSQVQGVSPRCKAFIIPIYDDSDLPRCSLTDLARAIGLALQSGADIINISGGEFSSSGTAHPILADAISNCAEKGVLVVAAAGNQGCECIHIPGALPNVLAVGAMNSAGEPMEFSNWGSSYRAGGILAPGVDIPVAEPGGGVVRRSGTSYAAPIVSGVAALLLSLARSRGITIRPHGIRDLLLRAPKITLLTRRF
jgi:subtilisin family serine protease